MDWKEWIRELNEAVTAGDTDKVTSWGQRFDEMVKSTNERVPTKYATEILTILQNNAEFALLENVGVLITVQNKDYQVRRRLAQAHIEMGQITRAISELVALREEIEKEIEADHVDVSDVLGRKPIREELPEVIGLLGRAYKKLYVDAGPNNVEPRESDFEASKRYYTQAYKLPEGGAWHGINLIALEGFRENQVCNKPYADNGQIQEHATKILQATPVDSSCPWDLATRAEALLALSQNRDAIHALKKYLEHPETTVFMVQSTRRNFMEMWRLKSDCPPGNQMLPMLDAAYAQKGGPLNIERALASHKDLEAILGDTGFQPINWLRKALNCASSVARVGRRPERTPTAQNKGTGFLIDGSIIDAGLTDKPMFLTNAHVTTSLDKVRHDHPTLDVLKPEETKVAFLESSGRGKSIGIVKEWFTSPPEAFDATLLELERKPDGLQPLPISKQNPVKSDRVSILGHPEGGQMVVSMQDNRVMEVIGNKLFYRTPTEKGSSGSPVFDSEWGVVALHHAGPGFSNSDANEGILIGPLFNAIRNSLKKNIS